MDVNSIKGSLLNGVYSKTDYASGNLSVFLIMEYLFILKWSLYEVGCFFCELRVRGRHGHWGNGINV